MKIVYIAHPVGGDVDGNLQKVADIGRKINLEEPGVVPFAPYYYDCATLQDAVPEERAKGLKNNAALMRACKVDEVRLYGNKVSSGMWGEVELAHELGIPVVAMTEGTKKEYGELVNNK